MIKNTRSKIIEIMENKPIISVKELASLLNVTDMTIRRNLDELADMGFVRREHGIAILLTPARKTDYYTESAEHVLEKQAIGRAALSFIQNDSSIAIDSGTTTQALIEQIPEDLPLSVITPSLTGAMALSQKNNVQVLLPEGFLHHSNRSVLLSDTASLQKYHVDIAFMSCRAFRPPIGAFEMTPTLASTKIALSQIATRIILLADFSKWGINALCNTLPMQKIDVIITDNKAPESMIRYCREQKKEVLIAN